ncbi:hypothetical protein N8H22_14105 [Stutzerimonas stutzeri]|uniref:hypothetical protein n=1 Tax=Stutzerimonas sp. S1 TaxID=3030652 RepID=UPI002225761F|nr:hypothetical protein [Stutzerimonas sp. S1]MCW3149735.1 hypothetical protein [Stutzerimonas sp. S1]
MLARIGGILFKQENRRRSLVDSDMTTVATPMLNRIVAGAPVFDAAPHDVDPAAAGGDHHAAHTDPRQRQLQNAASRLATALRYAYLVAIPSHETAS